MNVTAGRLRSIVRSVIVESLTQRYDVESLDGENIKKLQQFAYAVDEKNHVIYVSRSGHGKILRLIDDENAEDFGGGGWVFANKGKITFHSGLLGSVTGDKDGITSSLKRLLGRPLYVAD